VKLFKLKDTFQHTLAIKDTMHFWFGRDLDKKPLGHRKTRREHLQEVTGLNFRKRAEWRNWWLENQDYV